MMVDDVATDQCVNQSKTTDGDPGQVATRVRSQEKLIITWLFDTGADHHVMPKFVWEQLGEPALRPSSVTLRGANGQDLGAMREVRVTGKMGKIRVQFH